MQQSNCELVREPEEGTRKWRKNLPTEVKIMHLTSWWKTKKPKSSQATSARKFQRVWLMRCYRRIGEKREDNFKTFVEGYKSNPIYPFKMPINNGLNYSFTFVCELSFKCTLQTVGHRSPGYYQGYIIMHSLSLWQRRVLLFNHSLLNIMMASYDPRETMKY